MARSIQLSAVALAFVLAGCKSKPSEPAGEQVTVTAVVKGDELTTDPGSVRMLGIHAFSAVKYDPALENLGTEARAWTEKRLKGKTVTLVRGKTTKDVFGRQLAYVTLDGEDINRAMIEAGQAVVYTEYAFEREAEYMEAEARARTAKTGVWANDAAVELVRSLRSLWAQNRAQRGEPAPQDAWLAEVGPVEKPALPEDVGDVPEPELP